MALNLASKGGVPLASGAASAGTKAAIGRVANVAGGFMGLEVSLAVNVGFTAADTSTLASLLYGNFGSCGRWTSPTRQLEGRTGRWTSPDAAGLAAVDPTMARQAPTSFELLAVLIQASPELYWPSMCG